MKLYFPWSLVCVLTLCLVLDGMCTVDIRDMTYNKSLFNKIYEQEGGMSVKLGDGATYLMRGVGSITF